MMMRLLVGAVLVVALLPVIGGRIYAGGPLGDADCSGHVEALDAQAILAYDVGFKPQTPCPENSDVNSDGVINPIDAALILQYDAGIIPSL